MKKRNINLLFIILISHLSSSTSQQSYELNNPQLLCDVAGVSTAGYTCNLTNSDPQNCNSFFAFRSQTNYQTPLQISNLLNSDPSSISKLNQVPNNNSTIPINDLVLIPATCNCSNEFYQHNASYVVQTQGEIYQTIANNTYQGLTTCQALIQQNRIKETAIFVGSKISIPLRCACPTENQRGLGFNFLLVYIVTWGDTVSDISQRFGVDMQSVLDANRLSVTDTINPFTTLLVPMKKEPTKAQISSPPLSAPGPAAPAPDVPPTNGSSGSSKKWIAIGVAIGVVFIAVIAFICWYCCCSTRKNQGELPVNEESNEFGAFSAGSTDPFVSHDVRNFIESLTVYKYQELVKATNYFTEESRIKGSVYRALISKDNAAVKRLNGDVSNEIKILKQINHSNVVRLSGFCVHKGDTYLVYEFAEKGSLAGWIHHKKDKNDCVLSWKQRVVVAYDVAGGLNYLHNYTNPPYIHKNLKSSNILLDSEFRGKIANFGLARTFKEYEEMPQLTRHVVGTQGYMAPEYLEHGLITPMLDVFAFGVVLLELLSGKEAMNAEDGDDREVMLWGTIEKVIRGENARGDLKGFMDPCLRNEYPLDLAFPMAELAVRCVNRDAGSRPAMAEVLMLLSAIHNSTVEWDPSDVGNSGSMIHGR